MTHVGDCLEVLPTLDASSFDACVTDPPYHLTAGKKGGTGEASMNPNSPAERSRVTTGFMGKQWDGGDVAMRAETWAAVLRVLKPGAHLLAFGGTRTHHRMMCAIEDAGFELRDVIMWVYGSGFPKSLNLTGDRQGWGTALKPAWEPIVVARKPLAGTVAQSVAAHGTGAMNIDGCRIDGKRWPANLAHNGSEDVVALFPQEAGASAPVRGTEPSTPAKNVYGTYTHGGGAFYGDAGSAARFFYCAKASREDRESGCEGLPLRSAGEATGGRAEGSAGLNSPRAGASRGSGARNHHPTVKPHALMRWLCRLVTPPGGVILDPFAGSGSTAKAALAEGMQCVSIEREAEYAQIARLRAGGQSALPL